MRHVLTNRGLTDYVIVDSAGTHAYHVGDPPDSRAQSAALSRGVDLSDLRARRVAEIDFDRFDLIVAMDEHNQEELQAIAESHQHEKIRLLLEFSSAAPGPSVPDPYYGGKLGFQRVLDLVEEAIEGLVDDLQSRLPSPRDS